MSATFWIPKMGHLSPSFNVCNGNCYLILSEIGALESHDECGGTFKVEEIPTVSLRVEAAIEATTNDYMHTRLVQLREILKVAEYIGEEVSFG